MHALLVFIAIIFIGKDSFSANNKDINDSSLNTSNYIPDTLQIINSIGINAYKINENLLIKKQPELKKLPPLQPPKIRKSVYFSGFRKYMPNIENAIKPPEIDLSPETNPYPKRAFIDCGCGWILKDEIIDSISNDSIAEPDTIENKN